MSLLRVLLGGVLECGCNACGVRVRADVRTCVCRSCVCATLESSSCLCACGAHQHHAPSFQFFLYVNRGTEPISSAGIRLQNNH